MSDARITVIGLNMLNSHMFDGFTVPAGIDRELAIDTILMNCGELEPLYCDADFMQFAIGTFSKKWQQTFERWIKALSIDYEPLYNYDRYEKYTDDRIDSSKSNSKSVGSGTDTGTVTNEHTVSAYDSSTYQPEDKNTTTNNLKNDTEVTNNTTDESTGKVVHDAHLYGNIGIVSSQQMLEAELNVSQWNIYEHISDLFKTELTVMVY